MTQEEKELLLKDLCARLPYGVIVSVTDGTIKYDAYIESVSYKNIQVSPISDSNFTAYTFYKISEIKPYLRPMSSMTEEEIHKFQEILGSDIEVGYGFVNILYSSVHTFSFIELQVLFDWLNAHHFDYRGLIEKGLAIEVNESNNPYGKDNN